MIRKEYKGKKYNIPALLEVRFDFLTTKIDYGELENYGELRDGYTIVFENEFKTYETES